MDAKSEKIAQNILKTRKETRKEEKDILELRERALGV